MSDILFDRSLLCLRRSRVLQNFSQHNFLHHEVANRIAENLELLNLKSGEILEIGALDDYFKSVLKPYEFKFSAAKNAENLPKISDAFNAIIDNLNFHFVNEIPQFLLQVKNILKPQGVFIASFFGEENLRELAEATQKTEIEIYGGISPRMPPTIEVKTAATLLQKAGFRDAVSNLEKIEVSYGDPMALLKDLQMMGQSNILTKRSRKFFTKTFLKKLLKNYQTLHQTSDGKVKATFEIITITGWK